MVFDFRSGCRPGAVDLQEGECSMELPVAEEKIRSHFSTGGEVGSRKGEGGRLEV